MRTLVITPTYEEVANIEEFLRRTRAAVPDADVLVVDDNSPDGTGALAEQIGAELGQVHVLHRAVKEGLGVAYRAGIGWGIRGAIRELLTQAQAAVGGDAAVFLTGGWRGAVRDVLPGVIEVPDLVLTGLGLAAARACDR